ncbi:MAG: ABC transporter ATP-binding protein [Chloroflexota bacterium]
MTEKVAVQVSRVTKQFGEVLAVDDVSLSIKNGEFFAMLGPSGCGKTTTLRMIAGFETPTEGEIFIQGVPMGLTPPFQRNTNMVFQSYALFPHMTVAKNVAFGLEMKKVPKGDIQQRVEEALEMVRLAGLGNRKPDQLSGGQQQRVALARALVNRPSVLLLDEPLGALDLKLRKEMQIELKNLQNQVGITFVYVTHDQEEALTMSDRIAVMNGGKVLQVGTPTEIYEQPNCRFVADFIGESNFLEGEVRGIAPDTITVVVDGSLPVQVTRRHRCDQGQAVTLAVRPEKIRLHRERPPGAVNTLTGSVENVVYIGTDTQYIVRLTEQTRVKVREQNLTPLMMEVPFHAGEQVFVEWPPESGLVLVD